MQRTEKYFENDAFRKTAAGVILAAEADAKTGGGRIALDGTVFYPEGGGQPADRGTLTLADGTVLHVTDVHETNGIIWHTVDALPETAQPGAAVTGTIDWEWRFDKMQQHTGEHILSGILHQMFGAENVGFHIGSEAVRMDTSVPISAEGLQAAELAANRIVWQDVPVLISYPTREELAALVYRSKKEIEGQVRIVTIPGADVCACCGTGDGYVDKDGQKLTINWLTYPTRLEQPKLAEYAQATLKEIGIDVSVNNTSDHRTYAENGEFDVYVSSLTTAPTGDPEYFFSSTVTGSKNYGNYQNDEVTKLTEQLHQTFDTDERGKLAVELQQKILDDDAYFFVSHLNMGIVTKANVTGMAAHPCDYYEITADLDVQ